jgi:uncharacterized protein YecT (DUF1311 family)
MRSAVIVSAIAALLLTCASPALANPPPRLMDQQCDVRRLQPRELGECLRKAQEDSDRAMRDRLQAIAGIIDQAKDAVPPQKLRWKRALDEAQTMWLRFRNAECQELTPFESANKNRLAEEQRICLIEHNARRMEELARRYPTATTTAANSN